MTIPPPPNKPDRDALPHLEELLDRYADQLLHGPRANAIATIETALPDITNALIEAAKAGGVMACRLCFDLTIAPPFHDDDRVVQSDGER